jgi:endoglucanase
VVTHEQRPQLVHGWAAGAGDGALRQDRLSPRPPGTSTPLLKEPSELTWADFWVDTGLTREELLARGVTPGTRDLGRADRAVRPTCRRQGARRPRPAGRHHEVLRRVPAAERAWDLTLAASVQEEIGLIGATPSGRTSREGLTRHRRRDRPGWRHPVDQRQPDAPAPGRRPGADPQGRDDPLRPRLTTSLERTAAAAGITIQHSVFGSFGSDGHALMKFDIPSAMVAFPARYTHSPFETAHLDDIEELVNWLCAFVRGE